MTILPSDLSHGGPTPYRGYIDSIHGTHGVRGWAVNLTSPRTPPTLALRVGSQTAARLAPNRARDDISDAISQSVTAGFLFGPEALQRAAGLAATPYDLISVCIDGTDLELDSAIPPVRIGDLHITAAPVDTAPQEAPDPRPPQGTQTAIDRLLVIPGLGCMIDGWVLSPQKPVTDFRIRLGGVTFSARGDATYRKPRPDLLAAFPHADALVARAGFVALLTSEMKFRDLTTPILQLVFADGSTAGIELPPTLPRLLGHSATADDAMRFFPSLPAETFFPQFAAAVVAAERAALAAPAPIRLAPTAKTLIQILPEGRSDLFLTFESIAAACRAGLIDGLTFIAATDITRAETPWHLQDLLDCHNVPASLLAVADRRQAFGLLPDILRITGAKRFAYADAGLFLTPPSYRLVADYLRGTVKAPLFVGPLPDPYAQPAPHAAPTSRCFAWTTPAFLRWYETAPSFLGGHYRDNLLARASSAAKLHADGFQSSVSPSNSAITEAVNSVIYATALPEAAQA